MWCMFLEAFLIDIHEAVGRKPPLIRQQWSVRVGREVRMKRHAVMVCESDRLAVTDKGWFDDARLEALVANFDLYFAADGDRDRQSGQGN